EVGGERRQTVGGTVAYSGASLLPRVETRWATGGPWAPGGPQRGRAGAVRRASATGVRAAGHVCAEPGEPSPGVLSMSTAAARGAVDGRERSIPGRSRLSRRPLPPAQPAAPPPARRPSPPPLHTSLT